MILGSFLSFLLGGSLGSLSISCFSEKNQRLHTNRLRMKEFVGSREFEVFVQLLIVLQDFDI
jgi:hypothetical protein